MDANYLAGVFDSDGSVTVYRHARKDSPRGFDIRPLVQLTWKNTPEASEVLNEMKVTFGGSLHLSKGRYLRWVGSTQTTIRLLTEIIPFMRLKSEQAKIVLNVARGFRPGFYRKGRKRPSAEWDELMAAREKVMKLNARGNRQ